MDESNALRVAESFLFELGFSLDERVPRGITTRRGHDRPSASRAISQLPQNVRVEFDRGRVTIGASIREIGKATDLHKDLMLAIVSGLESVLVQRQMPEQARQPVDEVEQRIGQRHAKRRRRQRGCVIALVVVLVAIVVLITVAVVNS